MMEIELFDVEEDQVYKFPVTQENYNKIIAGDLELASKLLNEQKVKKNFVAAFHIMKESSNVMSEKQQNLSIPSTSGCSLVNETEGSVYEPTDMIDEIEDQSSIEDVSSGKIWTKESTKFLIELCKKYDKDFETGIKKFIWIKLAAEMSKAFKQKITAQQLDTKFKVLKNMYKRVKNHNEQSGNNKKNWEYYNLMEEIMFSKPEICAKATCSNIKGLTINVSPNVTRISGKENAIMDESDDAGSSSQFVSSFSAKRKRYENQAEKRHKEKLQRQDRYLDLLERLTSAVEKSVQKDTI